MIAADGHILAHSPAHNYFRNYSVFDQKSSPNDTQGVDQSKKILQNLETAGSIAQYLV